jgi:hypothetical protein
MRVKFGTSALTSLIILGLADVSKDSSMTLNIVFSLGFSYTYKPISLHEKKKKHYIQHTDFRWFVLSWGSRGRGRRCSSGHGNLLNVQTRLFPPTSILEHQFSVFGFLITFNSVTRSAACSKVKLEMSSTMRPILGSEGAAGGGGGVEEVAAVVVAVARHLDERNNLV